MKSWLITLIFFVNFPSHAGNGSSGTGTAMITNTIEILGLENLIERQGRTIINKNSHEKLMSIKAVDSFNKRDLIKARFGNVNGYEYLPPITSKDKGHWILCEYKSDKKCFRLDTLSKSDKLVPSILGSLKYKSK